MGGWREGKWASVQRQTCFVRGERAPSRQFFQMFDTVVRFLPFRRDFTARQVSTALTCSGAHVEEMIVQPLFPNCISDYCRMPYGKAVRQDDIDIRFRRKQTLAITTQIWSGHKSNSDSLVI